MRERRLFFLLRVDDIFYMIRSQQAWLCRFLVADRAECESTGVLAHRVCLHAPVLRLQGLATCYLHAAVVAEPHDPETQAQENLIYIYI